MNIFEIDAQLKSIKADILQLRETLDGLIELLTVRTDDGPRRPRPPTAAQKAALARRARQGRVAHRIEITVGEYIERFGDIDYAERKRAHPGLYKLHDVGRRRKNRAVNGS